MKEKDILIKLLNTSKIIVGLLVLILIFLVVGVSKMYDTGEKNTNTNESVESEFNTNYDVSMFEEIAAKDLKNKTKGKTKVVYIGRETCSWCAAFLPNLWDAQEEFDFTTLYIDIAKIIDFQKNVVSDEKAYDTLIELTGKDFDGYMEENFGATPMVLIIKDNKIINAQTGYSEYDQFKQMLEEIDF